MKQVRNNISNKDIVFASMCVGAMSQNLSKRVVVWYLYVKASLKIDTY